MSTTTAFLDDLRAKHKGDPEALLLELDGLLAKAKANEQELETKREAAEAVFVDAIAAAHLHGTTPPKLPEDLATLRDSEAAAEHLVDVLAAARQSAWNDTHNHVGGKLVEKCMEEAAKYFDRVARALALIRAGHTAYQMVTGGDVPENLIHNHRPRYQGQTDFSRSIEAMRPFQNKSDSLGLNIDLSHRHFIGGSVALDLNLDPLAAEIASKFLNKEI